VRSRGIPTSDQARALRFYTEQLGFEVATDQPFDDKQRWIELRIANAATRVVLFTPEGHEDRVGTFFNGSFTCDDVPATHRQLRNRGVEFVRAGEAAVGRVRSVQGSGRQSVRAVFAVSHFCFGTSAAAARVIGSRALFARRLVPWRVPIQFRSFDR
jgi:catechol 2,3-dioxygenase-like lactoylglutathione lyase family enzyme